MGFTEFMSVLSRRWALIVMAGVLAATSAYLFEGTATPTYSASAEVLVREGLSESTSKLIPNYMRNVDRDWNTRVLGLKSESLAKSVIDSEALNMEPATLVSRIQFVTDVSNGLVKVSVTDADPQAAAELTNAVVRTYADQARTQQEEALDRALTSAEKQLAAARARISALPGADGASPGAELVGLSSHEAAASLVDTLRVGAATQVDPVVVTVAAVAPSSEGTGGAVKSAAFGLLAGLALGLIVALLLEYLARSVSKQGPAS